MTTTNAMILDWAREKGILGRATALDQILKTVEELGELAGAVSKGDRDAQIDSIGDVYVTLVIVAEIMGLEKLPEISDLEPLKDDFGNHKRWVACIGATVGMLCNIADDHADNAAQFDTEDYVQHPWLCVLIANRGLRMLAAALGFTLQECVDHAYGIISKRKGRMVDGVFVKAEEVPSA